jgi:hypothetical protein
MISPVVTSIGLTQHHFVWLLSIGNITVSDLTAVHLVQLSHHNQHQREALAASSQSKWLPLQQLQEALSS